MHTKPDMRVTVAGVELCSPVGETLLQFPTRAVQDFIISSLKQVPLGREGLDVDAWIKQIFAA